MSFTAPVDKFRFPSEYSNAFEGKRVLVTGSGRDGGIEEIVERRPHALSRMPAGLLDTLEREEVLDLLAYLLQGAPQEEEDR